MQKWYKKRFSLDYIDNIILIKYYLIWLTPPSKEFNALNNPGGSGWCLLLSLCNRDWGFDPLTLVDSYKKKKKM